MLEQPDSLLLDKLVDHIAQDRPNGVKPLISLANVRQTHIIKQNLLHNEDCHGFAEFRSSFHYSQAERDDLGCEKEIDYFGRIVFDQCSDHAEGGETEVFEWSGL
jgi:hypothetical protein